ncbi:MAG: hypothetical protein ACOX61_08310 [Brooklawnia sp.]|jgi:hypothetical protein
MADRRLHRMTDTEADELRRIMGVRFRPLAQVRGPQALVVLLHDRMAVRQPAGWQLVAWTDIQRGGWDDDRRRLHWELTDGTQGHAELDEPGQLPHAFAERVRASIVVTRHVRLDGELGSVILSGRRTPGTNGPISWQVETAGRTDLGDQRVADQVVELVAALRAEFE